MADPWAFVSTATSWWGRGRDAGMSVASGRAWSTARVSLACRGAQVAEIGAGMNMFRPRGLGELRQQWRAIRVLSVWPTVAGGCSSGQARRRPVRRPLCFFCRVTGRERRKGALRQQLQPNWPQHVRALCSWTWSQREWIVRENQSNSIDCNRIWRIWVLVLTTCSTKCPHELFIFIFEILGYH